MFVVISSVDRSNSRYKHASEIPVIEIERNPWHRRCTVEVSTVSLLLDSSSNVSRFCQLRFQGDHDNNGGQRHHGGHNPRQYRGHGNRGGQNQNRNDRQRALELQSQRWANPDVGFIPNQENVVPNQIQVWETGSNPGSVSSTGSRNNNNNRRPPKRPRVEVETFRVPEEMLGAPIGTLYNIVASGNCDKDMDKLRQVCEKADLGSIIPYRKECDPDRQKAAINAGIADMHHFNRNCYPSAFRVHETQKDGPLYNVIKLIIQKLQMVKDGYSNVQVYKSCFACGETDKFIPTTEYTPDEIQRQRAQELFVKFSTFVFDLDESFLGAHELSFNIDLLRNQTLKIPNGPECSVEEFAKYLKSEKPDMPPIQPHIWGLLASINADFLHIKHIANANVRLCAELNLRRPQGVDSAVAERLDKLMGMETFQAMMSEASQPKESDLRHIDVKKIQVPEAAKELLKAQKLVADSNSGEVFTATLVPQIEAQEGDKPEDMEESAPEGAEEAMDIAANEPDSEVQPEVQAASNEPAKPRVFYKRYLDLTNPNHNRRQNLFSDVVMTLDVEKSYTPSHVRPVYEMPDSSANWDLATIDNVDTSYSKKVTGTTEDPWVIKGKKGRITRLVKNDDMLCTNIGTRLRYYGNVAPWHAHMNNCGKGVSCFAEFACYDETASDNMTHRYLPKISVQDTMDGWDARFRRLPKPDGKIVLYGNTTMVAPSQSLVTTEHELHQSMIFQSFLRDARNYKIVAVELIGVKKAHMEHFRTNKETEGSCTTKLQQALSTSWILFGSKGGYVVGVGINYLGKTLAKTIPVKLLEILGDHRIKKIGHNMGLTIQVFNALEVSFKKPFPTGLLVLFLDGNNDPNKDNIRDPSMHAAMRTLNLYQNPEAEEIFCFFDSRSGLEPWQRSNRDYKKLAAGHHDYFLTETFKLCERDSDTCFTMNMSTSNWSGPIDRITEKQRIAMQIIPNVSFAVAEWTAMKAAGQCYLKNVPTYELVHYITSMYGPGAAEALLFYMDLQNPIPFSTTWDNVPEDLDPNSDPGSSQVRNDEYSYSLLVHDDGFKLSHEETVFDMNDCEIRWRPTMPILGIEREEDVMAYDPRITDNRNWLTVQDKLHEYTSTPDKPNQSKLRSHHNCKRCMSPFFGKTEHLTHATVDCQKRTKVQKCVYLICILYGDDDHHPLFCPRLGHRCAGCNDYGHFDKECVLFPPYVYRKLFVVYRWNSLALVTEHHTLKIAIGLISYKSGPKEVAVMVPMPMDLQLLCDENRLQEALGVRLSEKIHDPDTIQKSMRAAMEKSNTYGRLVQESSFCARLQAQLASVKDFLKDAGGDAVRFYSAIESMTGNAQDPAQAKKIWNEVTGCNTGQVIVDLATGRIAYPHNANVSMFYFGEAKSYEIDEDDKSWCIADIEAVEREVAHQLPPEEEPVHDGAGTSRRRIVKDVEAHKKRLEQEQAKSREASPRKRTTDPTDIRRRKKMASCKVNLTRLKPDRDQSGPPKTPIPRRAPRAPTPPPPPGVAWPPPTHSVKHLGKGKSSAPRIPKPAVEPLFDPDVVTSTPRKSQRKTYARTAQNMKNTIKKLGYQSQFDISSDEDTDEYRISKDEEKEAEEEEEVDDENEECKK